MPAGDWQDCCDATQLFLTHIHSVAVMQWRGVGLGCNLTAEGCTGNKKLGLCVRVRCATVWCGMVVVISVT